MAVVGAVLWRRCEWVLRMREEGVEMWGSGAEPAPGEVETISLKNTEAGGHPVGLQRGNERRGGVLRRKSWGAWLLHVVVFALMMIQPRAAGISLAALASPKLGVEPEALWRKRRPAGGLCSRMVVAYAGEVVQPKVSDTPVGALPSETCDWTRLVSPRWKDLCAAVETSVVAQALRCSAVQAVPTFDEDGVRWSQVNGWKVAAPANPNPSAVPPRRVCRGALFHGIDSPRHPHPLARSPPQL